MFDSLHGYYRSAVANLRGAIELVAIGSLGNLTPNDPDYLRWRKQNVGSFSFSKCITKLRHVTKAIAPASVFKPKGWMQTLYDELCALTHTAGPMLAMVRCGKAMARSTYHRRLLTGFSSCSCRPTPPVTSRRQLAGRSWSFPDLRSFFSRPPHRTAGMTSLPATVSCASFANIGDLDLQAKPSHAGVLIR